MATNIQSANSLYSMNAAFNMHQQNKFYEDIPKILRIPALTKQEPSRTHMINNKNKNM